MLHFNKKEEEKNKDFSLLDLKLSATFFFSIYT